MAQLKMYWFPGTPIRDYKIPEGFRISNYRDERDIMPWVECCKKGLLKDDATEEDFHKRITRYESLVPQRDVFFLDCGDKHVGTVTVFPRSESNLADVHMVSILPEFRGRGLAGILSSVALHHVEELGCRFAFLTTDEWRKAAVKSYLSAGFLPVDYESGMVERWEAVLEEYGIDSVPMMADNGTFYRTLYRKGLDSRKLNEGPLQFYFTNRCMSEDSFGILLHSARRKFTERRLGLSDTPDGAFEVVLSRKSSLEEGRYLIAPGDRRVVLTAADDYTLHAAFGRWLCDSFADGNGGFVPAAEAVDFTPKDSLRGMYFATHFHNFYHNAPLEKVYEVIEDLALRGCNSLLVWFDMHHFDSMEDPAAKELTERLRAMLKYANRIGIGGSLTMLSNEGFKSSPETLRAEWWVQNGYTRLPEDHYHVELCPSKEGGIEEILRERRAMLECFSDLKIDYICYWPYDQGGCTCAKCTPWGANGFMKLYPHFRDLVREVMPNTRIIISTWYFDKFVPGEWDAFYPQIKDGAPEGTDYIMSFFFNGVLPKVIEENGLPKGVRFIDFPEISMWSCSPWGGFGASLLARFLNTTNEKSGHLYDGGFPYSEGIFEDVNKYCNLTYYSGQFEDARDAVRAYVRHEFCVEGRALDELTEAVLRSETGLAREKNRSGEPYSRTIKDTRDVGYVYRIFSKYDRLLPDNIRLGWKFRLWYLRAVIDRELVSCDGYPGRSSLCQEAFAELCSIYYATEETWRWVKPPIGL